MGFMDKLSAGAERAAKEAEKAFEKGKAKVGELQIEMQMDSQAKKLGYLVFDFYRGRQVDQAQRQKYLDELSRLEDELAKAKAEAAAKAQADADEKARRSQATAEQAGATWQPTPPAGGPGSTAAGSTFTGETTVPPMGGGMSGGVAPMTEGECTPSTEASEAFQEATDETMHKQENWNAGDA